MRDPVDLTDCLKGPATMSFRVLPAEESADPALLPCPFCGGPAEIRPWHGGKPTKKMVSCAEPCDVGPQVTGETRKEAIQKWNTRTDPARGRGVA